MNTKNQRSTLQPFLSPQIALLLFVTAVAFSCTGHTSAPPCGALPTDKPNILFILTDDQNPDTLGCFGGKVLTPTLDRLCRDGMKFTRAYTTSSVCTPSRYICLTGQYASRCTTDRFMKQNPTGQPSNVGFNVQIEPGSWNVARVLQENGYRTGFVGKWHTGWAPLVSISPDADFNDPVVIAKLQENQKRMCNHIQNTGFDYAASVYRGNLADHKLSQLKYHNMEWVTKGALEFLDRAATSHSSCTSVRRCSTARPPINHWPAMQL